MQTTTLSNNKIKNISHNLAKCLFLLFVLTGLASSVFGQCQLPGQPTISASPGPLHRQITFSSDIPTEASKTDVYYSSTGTSFTLLTTITAGESYSYYKSGLDTNKTYYFYAKASNSCGSNSSSTVAATTFDIDPPTISASPGPLHRQTTFSSNIPTGASKTDVYYSSTGTSFTLLTTITAGESTSYYHNSLDTNKTYYYYAKATSGTRVKFSETITTTTFDIDPPTISATAGPGLGKITFSSNIPTGASKTDVYYSSTGTSFTLLTTITAGESYSYYKSGLVDNKTYYFYAKATSGTREKFSGTVAVALYKDQDAGKTSCNISVGEPVNVINGNMYLEQTDYILPGAGEPINISRTYNSIIQSSGLFGLGWSTNYDENISAISDYSLRLGLPDGRAVYFGRTHTTVPFTPSSPDFYGQVVKNADNSYTLIFKDGRVHQFSATGVLLWQKDRNNNQTTLTYNNLGQLSEITDSFGRSLTVVPNSNGTVQQISDSLGVIATYEYYPNTTRLKTVTYNDGSQFKFEYTTIGTKTYLTTVKDALDNILETHQYDSSGRATTSEKHGGVEKYTLDYTNPAFTQVTDALGRVTKYYYDLNSGRNVVKQIEGNCGCAGSSQTVTYEYDHRLNKIKEIDASNQETLFTYDTNGNPLSVTSVLGTETYTYNSFGEILTRTDRMGGVITNTYDASGNLLTTKDALNNTTTLTYTTIGQLETITDARNNTATFTYDTQGRLTEIEDANNKTTTYAYDARMRPTSATNALNQTTSFEYDLNNRLKKIIYPDANFVTFTYDLAGRRTAATDARNNTTNYAYDNAYRLTSVTDALNHTTSFGYDLMSNRTSVTDALGNTTNYEYDDFNRLKKVIYPAAATGATRLEEQIEYDAVGNVKKRIDTALRETVYDYDAAHRLIKITDALNQITQFEYNARNQRTKVKDALNQEYVFTYDTLGRILSQTRAGVTMSYEYDAVGNRTKRTDYAGRVTDYTYDNLNRLTQIAYVNQSSANASYSYDDLSRLVSASNNAGTVSFSYDNRGRILSSTDVHNQTVGYGYDADGNRTSLTLNGTSHTGYVYDAANRLTTLTDEANQNFTFGYDIANKLISKNLPNGITTGYSYDGMSRLTRLKDEIASSVLFDRQLSYNTASQISQIAEPALTRNFGYDNIDRLTSVSDGTNTTESYGFDAVGNRSSSHLSANYGYQPFNRMTSTANSSFSYDANGNMTSKTIGSISWTYTWDYESRMVTASNGAASVSYEYDALGRRTKRIEGSNTTKFTYDGLDVVMDDDSVSGITKYQNGLGIDNKLKFTNNGTANYFLTDHLGSTNGLANQSGNITSSTAYDSFGNQTSVLNTRYGYTGRERDDFTGLMYYRARFYDAQIGRFISEDPIGFNGDDINLYGYVWNSPNEFTDPLGLDGWGNDLADWLDEKFDVAEESYGIDPVIGYSPIFGQQTFFGTLRGLSDLFRVGSGLGHAIYAEDENIYGRLAYGAMDITRGTGIFSTLAGPSVKFSCPIKRFSGTTKPLTKGATPNSVYTYIDPKTGKAFQNAIYDGDGNVVAHLDFKNHGKGASSGHGHKFPKPGDPSTGHGKGKPHIPYKKLPRKWRKLPKGVKPHTPIGN